MSEPLVRLGLVLAVLGLGLIAGFLLRGSARVRPASLRESSLHPGVYLFSSQECADCLTARAELRELLGESFTEITWEESPTTFGVLGVDLVPTTVIVAPNGSATLHPGVPSGVIERLNP